MACLLLLGRSTQLESSFLPFLLSLNLLQVDSVYCVSSVYLSENGTDGWISAELTHPGQYLHS